MPRTKQTTQHSQPHPNLFVRPTAMSGQQPPVTHQTFAETQASPDEPQPILPTQTPTTDVPTEETPRSSPIVIQPTGSSQGEEEIEVVGQVEAEEIEEIEEIEEAEEIEEEEAEAEEGDVSELTEDTAAAKKTKRKRKKSKEAREKKRSKHEKREAAGRPPKSKTPSTSTRTHPVSTGLTTSVVLKQLKKDRHQQLYGKEQTEDQDTPVIADSSSQDNEDIIKPPSRRQQPSSQAPSSQEPKEGDEDYETPPPVPR